MIPEHNKIKGVSLILLSSVLFSAMACLVKVFAGMGAYRMAFGRFFVGLLIMSSLWATGRIRLRFNNKPLLVIRGVVGSTAIFLTILAVVKLGIVKGTVILYSYPVYASLFGALFLKERLRAGNFAALGLALGGLYLLVVRGGDFDGFGVGRYELLAVTGAICAGLAVVAIRKLHETETSLEIFYAQCVFGTLLMVWPGSFSAGPIDSKGVLVLAAFGILAIGGQLTMTQGFRYLQVKTASVLTMSELVVNYVLGVLIFHEVLTGRSLTGAAMIAAGCVMAVLVRGKSDSDGKQCCRSADAVEDHVDENRAV
jgi:drug/metabolite transporter (DMT)-like permease